MSWTPPKDWSPDLQRGVSMLDELLDRNGGESEVWPLHERLRLLAAWFYARDGKIDIGVFHEEAGEDIQEDLMFAAELLEAIVNTDDIEPEERG